MKRRTSYNVLSSDENTTIVEMSYDDGTTEQKEYRTVTMIQIKKWVDSGIDIILDNAYIKDFIYEHISSGNSVVLKNFSAVNTFFDGEKDFFNAILKNDRQISFENSFWTSGEIGFENAEFHCTSVIFNKSSFMNDSILKFDGAVFNTSQNITFDNVSFASTSISFLDTILNKANLSISRSTFDECSINFDDLVLDNINIAFSNTTFKNTSISITAIQMRDGDISFRKAKFNGGSVELNSINKEKGNVTFGKAEFESCDVSLVNCILNEANFNFTDVVLKSDLEINNCLFSNGKILFNGTLFESQESMFLHVIFEECDISFGKYNRKKASPYSIANSVLNFQNTKFIGSDRSLLFEKFYTKENSSSRINFKGCFFDEDINLKYFDINALSFENCDNKDIINIQPTKRSTLGVLELYDIRNMGNIYLNWDDTKSVLLNDAGSKESYESKAQEMKMLKENYHNQGQYDWEDEAYVWFKRYESHGKFKISNILDTIGEYGTNPLRVFEWMLVCVVLFAALYCLKEVNIYPDGSEHVWWKPLYYSVITFFTVGYGDLSAQNGLTAVLCGIESFLGVFLMSYFSVALVHKTLR